MLYLSGYRLISQRLLRQPADGTVSVGYFYLEINMFFTWLRRKFRMWLGYQDLEDAVRSQLLGEIEQRRALEKRLELLEKKLLKGKKKKVAH
jgi:hypothetical protein